MIGHQTKAHAPNCDAGTAISDHVTLPTQVACQVDGTPGANILAILPDHSTAKHFTVTTRRAMDLSGPYVTQHVTYLIVTDRKGQCSNKGGCPPPNFRSSDVMPASELPVTMLPSAGMGMPAGR